MPLDAARRVNVSISQVNLITASVKVWDIANKFENFFCGTAVFLYEPVSACQH